MTSLSPAHTLADIQTASDAPLPFARLGLTGRPAVWRLLAAAVVMFVLYVVILGSAAGLAILFMPFREIQDAIALFEAKPDWNAVSLREMLVTFCVLLGSIAPMLPATLIGARLLHGRPMRSFITAARRVNMRAAFLSFGVFMALEVIATVIDYAIEPAGYSFVLNPGRYLVFLPFVLVLLPLQVLAEEVLFRGYLLQAVGRFTANRLALVAIPAGIFAVIHFANPEAIAGGVAALGYYVIMASYLTWITIKGNGLEYAFGLHLANNLTVFSILGNAAAPYPSPTVFYASNVNFALGLAFFAIMLALHYWICFVRPERAAR